MENKRGNGVNKVATYLNEHIQGEVLTSSAIRAHYATDSSVLTITPEMVVFPRTTNDIRKITRFAWQLAEKGHSMGITVRGAGTDTTGGAIGHGIVIDTSRHLRDVLELEVKQKLARVQPGIAFTALNDGLKFHSLTIPSVALEDTTATIGGAIAVNSRGEYSGKYGATSEYVDQLEVVLSSGDVLQTGRLSRREVSKKKGLQTFEGEIYRAVDGLISDNQQVIDAIEDSLNSAGYPGIAQVRGKDGSIDLTPLFAGSQGTLGIISEVIMKAEYVAPHISAMLILFKSSDDARDAMDEALLAKPAAVEYYDGQLLREALAQGKKYEWMSAELLKTGAALLVEADDHQERARNKRLKRLIRKLGSRNFDMVVIEEDDDMIGGLGDLRSVLSLIQHPVEDRAVVPSLLRDVMVPIERFDELRKSLALLAKKHSLALPLHGHVMDSMFSVYPRFDFTKVSDRQKMFKLLDEYTDLIVKLGGTMYAGMPEGRLRAPFADRELNDKVADIYKEVKMIFDPHTILNPGVKQPVDTKTVVKQLNARFTPKP